MIKGGVVVGGQERRAGGQLSRVRALERDVRPLGQRVGGAVRLGERHDEAQDGRVRRTASRSRASAPAAAARASPRAIAASRISSTRRRSSSTARPGAASARLPTSAAAR